MKTPESVVAPDASPVDPDNPWPGLSAFTEELAHYFHGRADEADDLLRRVKRKPLTILFGISGLGKTSLLQAGLFPLLRAEGFWPVPIRLDYQPEAPELGEQVKRAMADALEDARAACPPEPAAQESLWQLLHRRDLVWKGAAGHARGPVLVFDQFEEIFTLGDTAAVRAKRMPFLRDLADLIENRSPAVLERTIEERPEAIDTIAFDRQDCRILLSLREDYLAQLENLKLLAPSIMENRQRLTQMTGSQALEVLLKPDAGLVSLDVARQIVTFVARAGSAGQVLPVDELGDLEVPPPILSLFARRLNDRRRRLGLREITAELVNDSAGEILHTFYEQCLADQPTGVRAFVEEDLLTESAFRESMVAEQARKKLEARGAPAGALDVLIQRRLLQAEVRFGVQRVELTHDVLTEAIAKSRAQRRANEVLAEAAEREASLHAALTRQRRRLFAGALAAVAVLSVVSILAIYGWVQQREAARQRDLVSEQKALALDAIKTLTYDLPARLENVPGVLSILKGAYEKNLELLDRILKLEGDSPQAMREKQVNYNQIGRTWERLGDTGKASEAYDKARAIIERLAAGDPDNDLWQDDLAVSYAHLGDLGATRGDAAKALDEYRKALAVRERLAAKEPGSPERQRKLAEVHGGLSLQFMVQGELASARREAQKGLDIAERLVAQGADGAHGQELVARLHVELAQLATLEGDAAGAIREQRAALAAFQTLADGQPHDMGWNGQLANAHVGLANILNLQGDGKGAAEESRIGADIYERLTRRDPDAVQWRKGLAFSRFVSANALDDPARRVREFRSALALFESLAARDPANAELQYYVAAGHLGIAGGLQAQKQLNEALTEARAVLAVTQHLEEQNPKNVLMVRQSHAGAQMLVGEILDQQGDHLQAAMALRAGLELFRRLAEQDPNNAMFQFQVANTGSLLAHSLAARKQYAESCTASAGARQVIEPLAAKFPQNASYKDTLEETYARISWYCLLAGRPDAAVEGALKRLALAPANLAARMNLAHGYLLTGDFERAKAMYLENRNARLPDGRAFADVVLKDFRDLRSAGVGRAEMRTIERLLNR